MDLNGNPSTIAGAGARVTPVHTAVRGRVRFKVNGLFRSSVMKLVLENRLAGIDAIKQVSASDLTGNVLINFDPAYSVEQMAAFIEGAIDGFDRVQTSLPAGQLQSASTEIAAGIARDLLNGTEQSQQCWHSMESQEAVARAGGSLHTGLDSGAAARLLAKYGLNLLPGAVPRSRLRMMFDQFSSTPILLLMAAAGASLVTGGILDAGIILAVVGLNTAIGYATESQSQKTIDSLKKVVTPSAVVIRGGKPRQIPAYQVVVGDLVMLRRGSHVPADARLIEVDRLCVDESSLTGESAPVYKIVEPLTAVDLPLGDRLNMIYMGTLVTGGQALAVVVATGGLTEIGRIQALAAQAQAPRTPMQRQLDQMGRQLSVAVAAVCGAVFGFGLLRGYSTMNMLKTAIALAVAAVPEGLPAIATTILALGIGRMRKQHVLIRRLEAVETLGCVGAICLDKTGTLTLNRMSVVAGMAGERTFEVRSDGFWEKRRRIEPAAAPELVALLQVCALCSETVIEDRDGVYTLTGSPTENALVNLALSANLDVVNLRRNHPLIRTTLRSEDRSFMSTLHRTTTAHDGGSVYMTAVKGSPGQVLAMCSRQLKGGNIVELTADDRRAIEMENQRMAARALRVLGCAWREDTAEPAGGGYHDGLVWLGLVGLADPVRRGVADVIRGFHRAGIDTVMITGDQSPTAYAVGNELNLNRDSALEIVDSSELGTLDPDVLKGLAGKIDVFARVSPANKLQIVRALQRAGRVVAMTGDGINDGPALKAADIGVAMGDGGAEIAREVADVILEDDALETMLVAVQQGRTIYSNIRKAVHFLLSTNLSEVLLTFVSIVGGLGQPLTAMQLLWINLISDSSLGLALALEPPEPGIMEQPPRDPNEPIVRPAGLRRMGFESLTLSAGALGAYGYGVARYGAGPRARTLGFTALACGQILHALPSRSERYTMLDLPPGQSNPTLALTVAGSLALQGGVFMIPWLRNLLGVTGISAADALMIGVGTVAPLLINESAKKISVSSKTPSVRRPN